MLCTVVTVEGGLYVITYVPIDYWQARINHYSSSNFKMDNEIRQLVEMVRFLYISRAYYSTESVCLKGATPAQAQAAIRQCKDVMQAAELFFEGKFDHVKDEDDVQMSSSSEVKRRVRPTVRHFTIYDEWLMCTS